MIPAESIELVSLSHRGKVRERNEDAVAGDPRLGLAVLADGMGGHRGGDVAAQLAVAAALESLRRPVAGDGAWRVQAAFEQANRSVFARAQADPTLAGMGATLVALCVHEACAHLGHVGDSRAYLLRGQRLQCLTRDHTVAGLLGEQSGAEADAARTVYRGMLLRALGVAPETVCDLQRVALRHGDLLLLCSDGVHDVLPDKRLCELLRSGGDLAGRACAVVDAANRAGGPDNISVVLVRYHAPAGGMPWRETCSE